MAKDLRLRITGEEDVSGMLQRVREEVGLVTDATEEQTVASKKGTEATIDSALKYTELVSALSLVKQALAALQKGLDATIGQWQENAKEVADFNAMIGGTIEETSVLIEISKDFEITQDTLLAAMRSLANSGLEPTVEGLIELRAMLDACSTEGERLALSQEMIGEQGIKQVIPMLDQLTNEQLRNYIDTLTDAEKWTQEEIDRSIELRDEMKNLGDELDNITVGIGGWLAKGLLPWAEGIRNLTKAYRDHREEMIYGAHTYAEYVAEMKRTGVAYSIIAEAVWNAIRDAKGLENAHEDLRLEMLLGTDAAKEKAVAFEELTEAQQWQMIMELVLAGDYSLANKMAQDITDVKNKEDAVRNLIDTLKEWYAVEGSFTGFGGQPGGGDKVTPFTLGGSSGGGGGYAPATWAEGVASGRTYNPATNKWEFATGGSFQIGGSGGRDSQLVSFMGDPGEHVNISKEDSVEMLVVELRRFINTLPIMIRDAVQRV